MDLTPRALADVLEAAAATLRDQDHVIEVLKGALAAQGCDTDPLCQVATFDGLTGQGRALMGALLQRYPRPISAPELLDHLPGLDHAAERNPNLPHVVASRLRKTLGRDAIICQRGVGFSLSAAFYERLKSQPTGDTHGDPER